MTRKRIIVGVAGGIAAYKACSVVRQLTEAGHQVRVIPTESALRFVGAATFEALSGFPVHTGVFDDVHEVPHVRIGQQITPLGVRRLQPAQCRERRLCLDDIRIAKVQKRQAAQ